MNQIGEIFMKVGRDGKNYYRFTCVPKNDYCLNMTDAKWFHIVLYWLGVRRITWGSGHERYKPWTGQSMLTSLELTDEDRALLEEEE